MRLMLEKAELSKDRTRSSSFIISAYRMHMNRMYAGRPGKNVAANLGLRSSENNILILLMNDTKK
jgi:hypothetical protein